MDAMLTISLDRDRFFRRRSDIDASASAQSMPRFSLLGFPRRERVAEKSEPSPKLRRRDLRAGVLTNIHAHNIARSSFGPARWALESEAGEDLTVSRHPFDRLHRFAVRRSLAEGVLWAGYLVRGAAWVWRDFFRGTTKSRRGGGYRQPW